MGTMPVLRSSCTVGKILPQENGLQYFLYPGSGNWSAYEAFPALTIMLAFHTNIFKRHAVFTIYCVSCFGYQIKKKKHIENPLSQRHVEATELLKL